MKPVLVRAFGPEPGECAHTLASSVPEQRSAAGASQTGGNLTHGCSALSSLFGRPSTGSHRPRSPPLRSRLHRDCRTCDGRAGRRNFPALGNHRTGRFKRRCADHRRDGGISQLGPGLSGFVLLQRVGLHRRNDHAFRNPARPELQRLPADFLLKLDSTFRGRNDRAGIRVGSADCDLG